MGKNSLFQVLIRLSGSTMNKFKITLKLLSAVSTPLAADTLWGHIAWGIRYREGEEELLKWLSEHDSDTPPLILSEPFPSGLLPAPLIPRTNFSSTPPKKEEMKSQKANRKQKLIHKNYWENLSNKVSEESLSEAVTKTRAHSSEPPKDRSKYLHISATTHAGINRFTGGTQQEDDAGALFTVPSFFPGEDASFEVYVLSPHSKEIVHKWFENGLMFGYGKDASSGKGHLKVSSIEEDWNLHIPREPNAVMLLTNTTPKAGDPHIGFSRFTARCGRLGGSFSVDGVPGDSPSIQKSPVLCLQPGSVFLSDSPPLFAGRNLAGVHPTMGIRHYALGICLPVVLSDELVHQAKSQARFPQEVAK